MKKTKMNYGGAIAHNHFYRSILPIPETRFDGHYVILVSTENIKDPDIVPTDIEGHIHKKDKTVQSRCISRFDIKSNNIVKYRNVFIDISPELKQLKKLPLNKKHRTIEAIKREYAIEMKKLIKPWKHLKHIRIVELDGVLPIAEEIIRCLDSDLGNNENECEEEDIGLDERSSVGRSIVENLGSILATVFYYTSLQIVLKGIDQLVKEPHKLNSLFPKLVVACMKDEQTVTCDSNFKSSGLFGMQTDENDSVDVAQIDVYEMSDQLNQIHQVMICCPQLLQTLYVMNQQGKLSDREYQQQFDNFVSTLKDILDKQEQSSYIFADFKDFANGHSMHEFVLDCFKKEQAKLKAGKSKISSTENNDADDEDDVVEDCPEDDELNFDILKAKEKVHCAAKPLSELRYCYFIYSGDSSFNWSLPNADQAAEANNSLQEVQLFATQQILFKAKECQIITEQTCRQFDELDLHDFQRSRLILELILFIRQNHPDLWKKLRNSLTLAQHERDKLQNSGSDILDNALPRSVKIEETKHDVNTSETSAVEDSKHAMATVHSTNSGPTSMTEDSNCDTTENNIETFKSGVSDKVLECDKTLSCAQTSVKDPRILVIQNLLFGMIEEINQLPFAFEQNLRKLVIELKVDVAQVRNSVGLSLLHSVAVNNKPLFVIPLFRSGCFKILRALTVTEGKRFPYEGRTADEICTILKLRKVQKEIDTFTVWEKSMNVIHIAARKGSIEEVKRMLEFSQDLHAELDDMDCSTLYWAVIGGNIEVVQLLLSMKVEHLPVNSRKETLLHACCMLGHHHLVETLVGLDIDLTAKDCAKKTALLRVSENGDERTLSRLIECGMRKELLGPMLAIAGHYGRIRFIKFVVENYSTDPQSKDEAGKSAFLRAGEQGQLDVLKYMFKKTINYEEIDVRRRNIIHLAADGADGPVMEFILTELKQKNVNVTKMINSKDRYIGGELCMLIRGKDKGRDSWHYVEVVRALYDIFMKRTRGGTIDVAKYGTLLNSGWGADPDDGAAREIEKRFETRRNIKTVEDLDVTPLHIAAFKDKLDVAKLLVDNTTELNIHDKFGLTPLHIAAMRGNMDLVKLLVNRGANPEMLDSLVKTPAEVAEDNEHREVANYLKGLSIMPIAEKFCESVLPNVSRLLGASQLRSLHDEGRDTRAHMISTLRDLTVSINETLLALGSGPVLEESNAG